MRLPITCPGENENGGNPERIEIMLPVQWVGLAVLAYMVYQSLGPAGAAQRTSEISFQEFKTKLLAQGSVAKIEVVNNSLARVYVRPDALSDSQSPQVRPLPFLISCTPSPPSPPFT
jgi:hypothetical protein